MRKQGGAEVKRVSIKKRRENNRNEHLHNDIRPAQNIGEDKTIGYTMERVEQFIPNPLRCYNCQKYGHHEDNCRGRQICGKCDQQDPDYHTDTCDYP